jgi:L-serine dehydratase
MPTLPAVADDTGLLLRETYYSVGGGFIRREGEPPRVQAHGYRFDYGTAEELLALCDEHGLTIAELARMNEEALRDDEQIAAGLDGIWDTMAACVYAGLHADGVLPGMLQVKRRAGAIRAQLDEAEADGRRELPGEWLGAFALAVNEENAAGGRVVTAPTNGAAGILPAVAMYWWRFLADSGLGAGNAVTPYGELVGSALLGYDGHATAPEEAAAWDEASVAEANRRRGIRRFLLTATALGSLFKANASISGAEGGCQAEVGSACAMAAGGLTAVMGGTNRQIENAAEIAMEHHLGLTCDPVGGLVQIPCIERNAIAASTAVTAARLALRGDGSHYVSLDTVVETMRQTGIDMSHKYKETSEGGLAVNVIEC